VSDDYTPDLPTPSVKPPKPTPLTPILENIPLEFKSLTQWVLWAYEHRDGKWTKVPSYRRPKTEGGYVSGKAKANDSNTWMTFSDTVGYFQKGTHFAGVGLELHPDDPYSGIDIDHCRNPETGELSELAQTIASALDSYTEVSPSGTGLRIFVRGNLPPGGRKHTEHGVEMYDSGRYLTITGHKIEGYPDAPQDRQAALEKLHGDLFPPKPKSASQANSARGPSEVSDLSDVALLEKAGKAKNGPKFSSLWAGDWQGAGFSSQSEADLSLAGSLWFWTGGDAARADRLFHQSGLYRDKWDTPHFSDGRTYGQATLERCEGGEVYKPSTKETRSSRGKVSSKFSPRPGVESGEMEKNADEGENSSGFKMPRFPVGVQEGTDTANAYILARNGLNNRLRYSPGLGWLVYNPTTGTWKPDADLARAVQVAGKPLRVVVGRYYAEMLEMNADKEELSQVAGWANSVCNVKTVSNALRAAAGMDEFYTSVSDWDARPDLLNCLNGVLELRTQTLRPHCADDMFTRQAGAAYFADAQHPHVDKLLELLKADKRHDYLQRGVGSTLWGEAPNEVFQVLYGEGGTGKGTLVDGVTGMLGEYAHTADVNMLLAQRVGEKPSGPSPEMLELRGKRLVVCGEPPKGARFNAGKVKGLTGNDPVTARGMYSGVMVTFKPVFKLWVHTNYPVGAAHDDTGMQRRMRVTPFLTKPDKADPKFKKTLEDDPHARSALLKWAVEGFKLWFESDFDLGESDAVNSATTHYWSDQNPYEKFIAENLSFSARAFIPSSKLKIVFETWLEDSDAKGKISDLHAELTKRGCTTERQGRGATQGRGWVGVQLADPEMLTPLTPLTPHPLETPHTRIHLESSRGQAVNSVNSVNILETDDLKREEVAFGD